MSHYMCTSVYVCMCVYIYVYILYIQYSIHIYIRTIVPCMSGVVCLDPSVCTLLSGSQPPLSGSLLLSECVCMLCEALWGVGAACLGCGCCHPIAPPPPILRWWCLWRSWGWVKFRRSWGWVKIRTKIRLRWIIHGLVGYVIAFASNSRGRVTLAAPAATKSKGGQLVVFKIRVPAQGRGRSWAGKPTQHLRRSCGGADDR